MTTLLGLALGMAPAAGLLLWWGFCHWMADLEERRARRLDCNNIAPIRQSRSNSPEFRQKPRRRG